jgi:hypothetical protein
MTAGDSGLAINPLLDSSAPNPKSSPAGPAVSKTTQLGPGVSPCIDLTPFIEELRRSKNRTQTLKSLPNLAIRAMTEVEDED